MSPFDAELYNQSYELINEPDASLVITDDAGKNYSYTFSKTSNAYTLKAGLLAVGNYRYTGKVVANGQELTASGKFSVRPIQLEQFETTADHSLLRILSEENGGTMVFQDQLSDLSTVISENNNIQPLLYSQMKTKSVLHYKWIFFLLLFLLALEWFLRRYYGGY